MVPKAMIIQGVLTDVPEKSADVKSWSEFLILYCQSLYKRQFTDILEVATHLAVTDKCKYSINALVQSLSTLPPCVTEIFDFCSMPISSLVEEVPSLKIILLDVFWPEFWRRKSVDVRIDVKVKHLCCEDPSIQVKVEKRTSESKAARSRAVEAFNTDPNSELVVVLDSDDDDVLPAGVKSEAAEDDEVAENTAETSLDEEMDNENASLEVQCDLPEADVSEFSSVRGAAAGGMESSGTQPCVSSG